MPCRLKLLGVQARVPALQGKGPMLRTPPSVLQQKWIEYLIAVPGSSWHFPATLLSPVDTGGRSQELEQQSLFATRL